MEDSVIMVDGVECKVDVIIFGIGFKVNDLVLKDMIFGCNGIDLVDIWVDGFEVYKGIIVLGFLNLFFLVGFNIGLGYNFIVYMIEL